MVEIERNFREITMVIGLWLLATAVDRMWFFVDRAVPSWDPADYLTGSMNYWQALQDPQWLSGEWWTSLWLLSSKVPPLTYIASVPFLDAFGTEYDSATMLNAALTGILLFSVYSLGRRLFHRIVGLWAAGLCLLLPGLVRVRLDFLLDYPLTVAVTLAFACLTAWTFSKGRNWLLAIAVGISFGLAMMVKQTAILFLFVPVLSAAIASLFQRQWQKLLQLLLAAILAILICFPWYRTNWLLILTSGKRATLDSAMAEGDPALNTLDAWTYYLKILPQQVSIPLLAIAASGLIFAIVRLWLRKGKKKKKKIKTKLNSPKIASKKLRNSFAWIAIFTLSAYLLCSLNINKDFRYTLPYLPVISIAIAYGIVQLPRWIRWATVGLLVVLTWTNISPVSTFSPAVHPVDRHAYIGTPFPHPEVINTIIETEPYLRSTLGVLPSTPAINQHNFNYYGTLENFHVYGRQVGVKENQIVRDGRSLSWFLTKTGNQGSVPQPAQSQMVEFVETSPEFQMYRSWDLPDGEVLKLYRRSTPLVEVLDRHKPVGVGLDSRSANAGDIEAKQGDGIRLQKVDVADRVPPGSPVPITYTWTGSWQELQSALVLLTWKNTADGQAIWLHDRAIGTGKLINAIFPEDSQAKTVIERTAMLPPAEIPPGNYRLEVAYLDPKTGETYPVSAPETTINVDPEALPVSAPELDLPTQLRQLAIALPTGTEGLETAFAEVGRINQYDPVSGYLEQVATTLNYRTEQEGDRLDWAYAIGLARVLQRREDEAISAFQTVTELDAENPYAHAYLAFVYLYDWKPRSAQDAIAKGLQLDPNLLELKVLRGAANLMQGNIIGAWRDAKVLTTNTENPDKS